MSDYMKSLHVRFRWEPELQKVRKELKRTYRETKAGLDQQDQETLPPLVNLENELREIRGEERGRLRLGISVQRSIQLLPKVLPEFTRLYPKVEFRLHEAGSAYLEQMVQSGQVDLALASSRWKGTQQMPG